MNNFYLYHFVTKYLSKDDGQIADTESFRDSRKKHAKYFLGLSEIEKGIRDLKIFQIFSEKRFIP